MIRQKKSSVVPQSLRTTVRYDGEDVKEQLLDDQYGKCYICERKLVTDFEIEHLRSRTYHPELVQEWNNLFLSCSYCNGKKLSNFDDIANPLQNDMEDDIRQELDIRNKKALFFTYRTDASTAQTINLLNLIYNGTGRLRKMKEERFIEYIISIINSFSKLIIDYQSNPTEDNRQAVVAGLSMNREALGFKYWIIKSNPILEKEFSKYIAWNKIHSETA